MTISTVGYGDISPSPDVGMRIFTVLYILVGSGYAFSKLAKVLDGVLEAITIWFKRRLERKCGRDRSAETGDGTAGQDVTGRSIGIAGAALDLDGDGTADFIQPPLSRSCSGRRSFCPRCASCCLCDASGFRRSRAHSRPIHLRKVSISAPAGLYFASTDIVRLTCAWAKAISRAYSSDPYK